MLVNLCQNLNSYTADGNIKWYNHFEKTVWQFLSLYFFFIRLFKSGFRFATKLRGRYRDFPFTAPPPTQVASLIVSILYQSGPFVTVDEPASTHDTHPKSTVYIRVHSWCCIFHGLGQTYNDMYSSLQYHIE